MPVLKSTDDLVRVLGDVVGSEDPIGELRRRGFQITGALDQALRGAKPSAPLSVAQRRRFARLAGKGKVKFRVGAPAARPDTPLQDDYDVIAGIRLTLADEILNGLRHTQTIPQQIPLERLLTQEKRARLATELRKTFKPFPNGSEAGTLTLRDGISLTPMVDRTDFVQLNLPLSLEIVRTVDSGGVKRREIIGTLSGTLSVHMALNAVVRFQKGSEEAALVFSIIFPLLNPFARLDIDADSTLQPISPEKLVSFAVVLQAALHDFLNRSFEVSPFINVPNLPGVQLVVGKVDVRAVATPDGDFLMAGVRFGDDGIDPIFIELPDLRPDAGRNIVLRVSKDYLELLFKTAFEKGVLDRILQKESGESSVRVKSAPHVELAPGQIKIFLDGVIPNKCGPVDVDFTVEQTFSFFLEGGAVRVKSLTEVCVSTGDTILCAAMAFIAGLIASLPILLVAPFLGVFQTLLIAGDLLDFPEDSKSTTLIPLDSPIPRTELLPVLTDLTSRVEDGVLQASATAALRQDDINTYIYARFLNRVTPFDPGSPLAGARVQVCDQDAPPPAGDDVVPPKEGETEHIGEKFIRTVTRTYERPRSNPVLAEGTTDFDGRVNFTLSPAQVSQGAGHVVTQTTTQDLKTHETETTTTRRPVVERAADIFFLVHALSDIADTRGAPGGLIVNLRSKRVGTPTAPLTFALKLRPTIET